MFSIFHLLCMLGLFFGNVGATPLTGADWELSDAPDMAWSGIDSSSSGQYAVATVANGQIYYSFNYGKNWSFSDAPAQSWNAVASGSSGQQVLAVGAEIYVSKDFGYSWTNTSASKSLWLGIASSANGDVLYAANGETGGIYLSINNGSDWTPLTPPSVLSNVTAWGSLECSGTGQYVYASAKNMIYGSQDFGASWSATNLTSPDSTTSIALAVADDGLTVVAAINYGDLFYSWTPDEWRPATPPTPQNYSAVVIDWAGENNVAAAWSGEMYFDSDYGRSWTPLTTPGGPWSGLAMDDSGLNLIAIQDKGQIYYSIGGTPLPPVPTPIPFTVEPSATPSAVPSPGTTVAPTVSPTFPTSLVQFTGYQVVQGLSLTDYQSDVTNNQNTLASSIAACMTNVTSNDILNLQASSYSSASLSTTESMAKMTTELTTDLTTQLAAEDTSAAIAISYIVQATIPGATYNSLSAELNQSISSGYFDSVLHTTAVTNNAVYLVNATSDSVTTTEVVNSSGDDDCGDCLSTGAIVGIAIGCAVALCVFVAVCLWFRKSDVKNEAKISLV